MSTETEQALALVFRRFQETPVSEDELVKTMSLTLNWTKPSSAANLLDRGVEVGLLDRGDDGLTPRFNPGEVDVEFGFDPSEALFEPVETTPDPEPQATPESEPDEAEGADEPSLHEDASGPVLEPLVEAIAEASDGDRKAAIAAVNAKQEQLGGLVTLPTAALIVAHEHGVDARDHARTVLEDLRNPASA